MEPEGPRFDRRPVKIRVVGISGSLREHSFTTKALRIALEGAKTIASEVTLVELRELKLGFAGSPDAAQASPDLAFLRSQVAAAHGILLGTPEYHGSFSGVLKNALDLMGFEEFEGKMIGLVGVSGGRAGAFNALNGLRDVGNALHAWVLPQQAAIPDVAGAFLADGRLKDSLLEQRLRSVGERVAEFARLHECRQVPEFAELWRDIEISGG